MSTPNNESQFGEFMSRYREVIRCLQSLEGRDDAESNRLRSELLDELMCMDMALGPWRKVMNEAAGRRDDSEQGPARS